MCGIGGIRRMADSPIRQEQLDLLLCSLQTRGIDASGVALLNGNQVEVCKADDPAWRFVTSKGYNDFIHDHLTDQTSVALVHTRAATKGSPRVNDNNHPMFFDKAAVVHNGVITNDDTLFRDMKLDRHAETDSDILRAIVDAEGINKKTIRQISRCFGSVACAAITPDQPDKLLLIRSGSPLVLAAVENQYLVWASEKQAIHKAMRPWIDQWGLTFQVQSPMMSFLTMADNSGWISGPNGLEWHDECKTAFNYTEPRRAVHDNYQQKQARWGGKKKASPSGEKSKSLFRVKCENCNQYNRVTTDQYNLSLEELRCGSCDNPMAKVGGGGKK